MQGSRRVAVALTCAGVVLVAPVAEAARFGERTLRQGMHGADVKTLQRYLTRVGHRTTADGEFGARTARAEKAFERDEGRRADGVVTASDARLLRRRATESEASEEPAAPEEPEAPGETARLTSGGLAVAPASAPPEVKAVIRAGNRIARKPYRYGGGHGRFRDSGYDCSGSVSYALHGAGLVDRPRDSGEFMSWESRGRGNWITIRANGGHVYMMVAGLRFDTSGLRERGTRWTRKMRSARGYRGRHPDGL